MRRRGEPVYVPGFRASGFGCPVSRFVFRAERLVFGVSGLGVRETWFSISNLAAAVAESPPPMMPCRGAGVSLRFLVHTVLLLLMSKNN